MKLEKITQANQRYLRDESGLTGSAEDIIFPESEEELSSAVRQAAQEGLRLTFQGACTGLAGGACPGGGRIVNLSLPDKMSEIENGLLTVQCGVTLEDIRAKAAAAGMFFPPDPTEQTATAGGMFASGGGGPSALGCGPASGYI